jgi:hypothetical protein
VVLHVGKNAEIDFRFWLCKGNQAELINKITKLDLVILLNFLA